MEFRKLRKRAAVTVAAAGIVLGGTVALAAPASAGTPPYPAECRHNGVHGDAGGHRLVRYNHVSMRHNNAVKAHIFTYLAKGKRLHLFYLVTDDRPGTHKMWASRAYVGGKYVCGYVYASSIDWNHTW